MKGLKQVSLSIYACAAFLITLCPATAPLTLQAPNAGPVFSTIVTNTSDYANGAVPRYGKVEITFSLNVTYTNPFDPAQIKIDGYFTAPDNSVLVQPGFYYQDYVMTETNGIEEYTVIGNPVWKVRFAPKQTGQYQFYIKATDQTGTSTSSTAMFAVVDTGNPGFVRISNQNHRYFGTDDGHPFLGIGLNVAWWQDNQKRLSTYAYYIGRMNENKANMARVWMTNSGQNQTWIMSVQDKTLGADYNLEKSWAFDSVLEMARKAGIYFLLTLDDVNQYTYNWPVNLYSTTSGGPCAVPSCVFTNATAKENQRRVFRYLVARWGYSTNILSWELFNEISELEWSTANWDWCQVVAWHREMAQYIASIDAQKHLINSSTGSFKTYGDTCGGPGNEPDLYAAPEIQFAQIHYYYVAGCCSWAPSDPAGQDMADLTRYYAFLVHESVTDKPSIIGEWGLLNAQWTDSPYLASDVTGVFLHEGLWSSVMSGMAATGLSWHWASFLDHDPAWWQQYRGIANYLADIDIAKLTVKKPLNVDFTLPYGADNRPDAFASTNSKLRVMGLDNGNTAYVWVENTGNTWWNEVHNVVPIPESGTVTIYQLASAKRYTVTRWNTSTGQISQTETITALANGSLLIPVQALSSDIALKIRLDPTQFNRHAFLPLVTRQ